MFGVSIYLNQSFEEIKNYINEMNSLGVMDVFSSFHINEYSKDETLTKLEKVASLIREKNMDLILDISSNTLELYKFNIDEMVEFLKGLGIKKVRLDYGFDFDQIKTISESLEIVLNASTIDAEFINELEIRNIDLSKLTASHNFYPRPETGLSSKNFRMKNEFLKKHNFKIQAFIPGDEERRGPIFEGLPSLEEHRNYNSFRAYLDLKKNHNIEYIHIGDFSAKKESIERIIQFENHNIIELRVEPLQDFSNEINEAFYSLHQNRSDNSDLVARSTKSRLDIKNKIKAKNTVERKRGSITIDNEEYLRYSGEIQIALKDLKEDKRVNVLAKVIDDDLELLDFIRSNTMFKFKE